MIEPAPLSRMHIALIGAGRVGTAVTELLRRRGHVVTGVASRTAASAQRAGRLLNAPVFDLATALPDADLVLIGAPDPLIPTVVAGLESRIAPGTRVVHFAGPLGIAPLDPVRTVGGRPGALHPVAACPDVESALRRLPGSSWGVTCDDGELAWSEAIVREELSGTPVFVAESIRPLWHAAAVTTANGIAAMLATGEAILERGGIADPVGVLGPLAAGAVANAREGGGGARTLTGPVVRGDASAVAAHLAALRDRASDLTGTYATVARLILDAGERSGRLESGAGREIRALLDKQ